MKYTKEIIIAIICFATTMIAISTAMENIELKEKNIIQAQVIDLDNEIISLAVEGGGYCAKMITATAEYDLLGLNYLTERMDLLIPYMIEANKEKSELLEQLESLK